MTKNSNLFLKFKESCRRWDGSNELAGEWTYEGDRKTVFNSLVAVDGFRSRYKAERMSVRVRVGA